MQVKENSFLVTGGASGLGESVARAIVSQGGNVVIADLNESAGQSLVAELGDSARFVRCDITNGDEVQSAVEMAESAFGGLQGSINCAGIVVVQKIHVQKNADHGIIINTASIAAFDGQVGQASYSSSKAGVVGLTLPLARELARHGIRVMTIAPGVFATPMMESIPEKAREQLEAGVPYPKRLGAPNEFAKLVTHIIDNAYLNGEVIRLDGAIRMV